MIDLAGHSSQQIYESDRTFIRIIFLVRISSEIGVCQYLCMNVAPCTGSLDLVNIALTHSLAPMETTIYSRLLTHCCLCTCWICWISTPTWLASSNLIGKAHCSRRWWLFDRFLGVLFMLNLTFSKWALRWEFPPNNYNFPQKVESPLRRLMRVKVNVLVVSSSEYWTIAKEP